LKITTPIKNAILGTTTPPWKVPQQIRALTTKRTGGTSRAPYDELNLADHVGDQPESVLDNRQILQQKLALPGPPVWLSQVHGTNVVDAVEATDGVIADGSFTDEVGVVCAVMTADCLPLFLCSQEGDKAGILHVGWRGLSDGVIETGLDRFAIPGRQLIAATGPAIGPNAYEVGEEVYAQFTLVKDDIKFGFKPSQRSGHWLMDLYKLVELRLKRLGVEQVSTIDECTYTQTEEYFSYRREHQCGRMASLIWIDGTVRK